MILLFYIAAFAFACFFGSFLNVVVDRLPRSEGFVTGRSYCESCKRNLSWHDLVPILSFLYLGGKCRYCRSQLSYYYPVVEAMTGLFFAVTLYLIFGADVFINALQPAYLLDAVYFLALDAFLIIVFFTDLKYGIIPFKIVFSAIAITLVWYVFLPVILRSHPLPFYPFQGNFWLNYLLSALGIFLFFFSIFFASKGRGLGFGDVVYVILMGLVLGFPKIILGVYIAFLSGALLSILLVTLKKKKLHGGTIPFGPFLVLGTVISLYWGEIIVAKVMTFF